MFKGIQEFFESRLQEGLQPSASTRSRLDSTHDQDQIRLATAALMFEIAHADNKIDAKEREQIERLLGEVFDLSVDDARTIAELARQQSEDSTSLHSFTSLVNRDWPYEERARVIEMMWQVAMADGRLDAHEQHLMRKLSSLLYIPHNAYIAAKIRAQEKAKSR